MTLRPATPEETAAFQAAQGQMDPRLAEAKGIDTSTPVREPGQASRLRPATPEETAQYMANQKPAADRDPAKPPDTRSLAEQEADREMAGQPSGLTPTSKLGKLALQASDAFLGNTLPAALGKLPGVGSREDWAKAVNESRKDTGLLGMGAEMAGAVANPVARLAGPVVGGAAYAAGEGLSQGESAGDIALHSLEGGALGYAGHKVIQGLGALKARFPEIADALAARITGMTPKELAARILSTEKGAFPAGQYADDVTKLGLLKPTARGTMKAGVQVAKDAGSQLENLRSGRSVPVSDVEATLPGASKAAPLAEGQGAAFKETLGPSVDTQGAERSVSLKDLAEMTQQHINDPLRQLSQKAAVPNAPFVAPSEISSLARAKNGLEWLQRMAVQEGTENPGATGQAYDAARKAYAIGSQAAKGTAKELARSALYSGIGGTTGYVLGGAQGAVVGASLGTKTGRRVGAYSALKAYNASRGPAAQALGKVAQSAVPGVQQAIGRALSSGEPAQAGVAIQKAQANDPDSR